MSLLKHKLANICKFPLSFQYILFAILKGSTFMRHNNAHRMPIYANCEGIDMFVNHSPTSFGLMPALTYSFVMERTLELEDSRTQY